MAKGKVIAMGPGNNSTEKKSVEAEQLAVKESIDFYQGVLKESPQNQQAYNRLMILYRGQKSYKKELQVIEAAIRSFESLYHSNSKIKSTTISRVSRQLNLAFGLTDKKGKILYEQEPIATWKKRRKVVLDKIQKKN